jgi:hypothetical protein
LTALWVALAAGAAAFAAAELLARAWLARCGRYDVWEPGLRLDMEIDRATLPQLEPRVRFEVNRDGERGDEPPPPARGTWRALVAGGSAAECFFLDQDSAWPQRVQRALSEPAALRALGAERAHVGSIGRSLVTCEHVETLLARVLPRYERLDAVVLMVGASDVVTWLETTPPSVREGALATRELFNAHPEGPFGWRPSALALRRIAARAYRRHLRPVERRARCGKRLAEVRAMRASAPELATKTPDPAPLVAHYEKHLRRLCARARTKAARVGSAASCRRRSRRGCGTSARAARTSSASRATTRTRSRRGCSRCSTRARSRSRPSSGSRSSTAAPRSARRSATASTTSCT